MDTFATTTVGILASDVRPAILSSFGNSWLGLRRKTFKIATDVEFYAQAEILPYASVLNSIADRIRQKETHRDILMQRVQNLCKDRCKMYAVRDFV